MTERIIIELDDAELATAISHLIVIGSEGEAITGTKNLAQGLPSINREMRIILGQVPGMREAMRTYFNLKRLLRPIGLEEGRLVFDWFKLALAATATLIVLMDTLERRQERIERRQREYENFIRRERGLTHDQYVKLMGNWESSYRSRPG